MLGGADDTADHLLRRRPPIGYGNHRSFCAMIPFSSRPVAGLCPADAAGTRAAAANRMVEESIGGARAADWAQFL